jgi:hypothetical protein
MTGNIKFPVDTSAYNSIGLTWSDGTNDLTHIGSDIYGGIGIYANNNIYLRPQVTEGYTYGVKITKTTLEYNTKTVAHAGNITSNDTTIGTSLTTIATIAGKDIKVKIADYALASHAVSITSGTATSGKYISALSASGHTITVTKADLPTLSGG